MIASGPTAIPYQRHLARSFSSHSLSLYEFFTIHLLFCCLPCGNAAGHSVRNVSILHSLRSLGRPCLEHNLFLHISRLYVALPCHSTHFSSATRNLCEPLTIFGFHISFFQLLFFACQPAFFECARANANISI